MSRLAKAFLNSKLHHADHFLFFWFHVFIFRSFIKKKFKYKEMSPDIYAGVRARSLCNPMDHSLPGSSVHGILQARILEWVAMPSSRGTTPRMEHESFMSPTLADGFFTASTTWKAQGLLKGAGSSLVDLRPQQAADRCCLISLGSSSAGRLG